MATGKSGAKSDKDLCRLITPKFRVSYPHVFKAQSPKPGDKPKFSVTMLFPKDSELMGQTVDGRPRGLKEVIKNAKIAEFGPKENWPDDLESPVNDGDVPDNQGTIKEGYADHWVIKASTGEDQRPGVVDEEGVPITGEDAAKFYPGCYARAYVYAYVWFYPNRQKPMKKGVGFILDHVQKMGDGKSFGGKKPVDQVFGPVGGAGRAAQEEDGDDEQDFK